MSFVVTFNLHCQNTSLCADVPLPGECSGDITDFDGVQLELTYREYLRTNLSCFDGCAPDPQ